MNFYVNPFVRCKKYRDLYTQEILKEIINLFRIHKTVKRVSILTGKSERTIKKILKANNIETPTKEQLLAQRRISIKVQQEILQHYKNGISGFILAKQYNVNPSTVWDIAKKYNAQKNIPNYTLTLEANKKSILALYAEGKKFTQIGAIYNCLPRSVALFIRKYTNEQPRKKSKNPIPIEDIEKINNLHNEQGMTMKEIGKLYNCTFPCVREFFDKHNIPRRSKSEAIRLKNYEEPNMRNKLRLTAKLKEVALPSGKVVKVQGFEDSFLRFIFDNNLLKEEDIDFAPEIIPYIQNNVQRKYIPDFFIPKLNAIIEVKSWWTVEKQGEENLLCKQKAVEEKGYKFCLVLDNNFNSFLALINS